MKFLFAYVSGSNVFKRSTLHSSTGSSAWSTINGAERAGEGGPVSKFASSLRTFWKWYLLVYNQEVGHKIDLLIQVQGQDVRYSQQLLISPLALI